MAALLYLGDYVQARHLWRRHRDNASQSPDVRAVLEQWWKLAGAMMEYQMEEDGVWVRLQALQQGLPSNNSNNPQFQTYAQEVGTAYCLRLVPKLATVWDTPSSVLLGLPRQDWVTFLEQQRKNLLDESNKGSSAGASSSSSDMTEIIAFLESPLLMV